MSRRFSSSRTDFLPWPYLVSPAQGCFYYFQMKIPSSTGEPCRAQRNLSNLPVQKSQDTRTAHHYLHQRMVTAVPEPLLNVPASANHSLGTARASDMGLYWPGWMWASCFGSKKSLRVQALPDGFRDSESSTAVFLENQSCLPRICCICLNKSRATEGS